MNGSLHLDQCTTELDQMFIRITLLSDIPLINRRSITENTIERKCADVKIVEGMKETPRITMVGTKREEFIFPLMLHKQNL